LSGALAGEGTAGAVAGLSPWLGLAAGLCLVAINGFFVAAEFALVKLRPNQLAPRIQKGELRARTAQHLLDHLDSYLSAAQLGITLASLALGWIGEPAFAWIIRPLVERIPGATETLLHSVSLTTAFLCITSLHIVLGEQAPKWLGIRNPEAVGLWIALPMFGFHKLTFPLTWLLNKSTHAVLRLVNIDATGAEHTLHSEEELRLFLASGDAGRLSKQKRELLDNVFELSHRSARQVMVPRADVAYLSTTRPLEDNLTIARDMEFTRFPLCTEDLDQIVGMIHIKDLFRSEKPPTSLEEIRREIHFVPETLTLDRLLRRMRREREHMVAVVDEYGGVSGIVTLEDVIEEIVGQIQDEFDQEQPDLVPEGSNRYRVSGTMLVVDLEDALDVEFSERDEDTVGGVVLSELGRQPRVGDAVDVGEVHFEVLETSPRRIHSVMVTIKARVAGKSGTRD
jgi:CBS domain containing-hemolysin-like protein